MVTSCPLGLRIEILGAGASGADVMLIMSGSLMGIMPKVMFLEGGVVGAPHLVDLVRLGHHHAVALDHHRVRVNSALCQHKTTFGLSVRLSYHYSGVE